MKTTFCLSPSLGTETHPIPVVVKVKAGVLNLVDELVLLLLALGQLGQDLYT
jgi:hypothetical protein